MHPVNYLFDEIYRDYWGIPQGGKTVERKRPTLGSFVARQARMFGSRGLMRRSNTEAGQGS